MLPAFFISTQGVLEVLESTKYHCSKDEQAGLQKFINNVHAAKERLYQHKAALESMEDELTNVEASVEKAQAMLDAAVNLLAFSRGESEYGSWKLSPDCSSIEKVDNANASTNMG